MLISSKVLNTGVIAIAITTIVAAIGILLDGEVVPKPVHEISLMEAAPKPPNLSEKSATNLVDEFLLPESPVTEKGQQQREQSIKKADELIEQMDVLITQQDLPTRPTDPNRPNNKKISHLQSRLAELKATQNN